MFVVVNGCEHQIPEPQNLAELLARLLPPSPFAVARNEEFVPLGSYQVCLLCSGDRIEIVHPMAGG